jgi:hypothetical protein
MKITWHINNLEHRLSDGFVTVAHWTVSAQDNGASASSYGTCNWQDGKPVVPYEALTEATVLSWVWDSVDKQSIESKLTDRINEQLNPTQANGLPWESEGE